MLNLKRIILISTCLTILFVVPFAFAQEMQTVLKPNQLITFSLVPEQEKLFVLQMKKGDFADVQWLAGMGLNLSFVIYDSVSKEQLEKSFVEEESMWFVAPRDGNFILVCRLDKSPDVSNAQTISLQYNNKFRLPSGTRLNGIRKVNGFDVSIMTTPTTSEGTDSVLLIEKNGQLQKAIKSGGGSPAGFFFGDDIAKTYSAKERRGVQLIKATVDKTGNGVPDIVIGYYSGGAHCCSVTYFIDLGDVAKTIESISTGHDSIVAIGKNPKGGLLFEVSDTSYAYWLTAFAFSPSPIVILEFRNGVLRPNISLMKRPPPPLKVLRSKAGISHSQLSLEPYKGADNSNSVLYREDSGYEFVFWGVMLDLIYTSNEELAWQFLDLVWPLQKQGKAIFIRDFKNQLLESPYWQMILEDKKK